MQFNRLGILGFGEVGKVFGVGLRPFMQQVSCWDLKLADPAVQAAERSYAQTHGLHAGRSVAEVVAGADLLLSAVTASNTLAVAREVALNLRPGTVFLDLNSASPGTKQQACAVIESVGGHFVEAGVMTSVPPYGIGVPMLLGGAQATELARVLCGFGMDAQVVATRVGVASAIKMCRSVMIKGLEALVIESYATARHYGVEAHMIPTLAETFPSIDWEKQGAYFFSRVAQHGKRRAEEMREVANTVREAGFEPWMSAATAQKHDWFAQQSRTGTFDNLDKKAPWQDYADRLLGRKAL